MAWTLKHLWVENHHFLKKRWSKFPLCHIAIILLICTFMVTTIARALLFFYFYQYIIQNNLFEIADSVYKPHLNAGWFRVDLLRKVSKNATCVFHIFASAPFEECLISNLENPKFAFYYLFPLIGHHCK